MTDPGRPALLDLESLTRSSQTYPIQYQTFSGFLPIGLRSKPRIGQRTWMGFLDQITGISRHPMGVLAIPLDVAADGIGYGGAQRSPREMVLKRIG